MTRISRSPLAKLPLIHLILPVFLILAGCTGRGIKPVELYPEDMCALCRMAVSDHQCASEIILASGEVFKFDDIRCLERYTAMRQDLKIAAVYVKDYDTKGWLAREKATIVATGVFTPMGSGRVAFGDSTRALEFQRLHPVEEE